MLSRAMVVVLLGCVELAAGITFGTLVPSAVVSTSTTTTVCQHFGCLSDLTVPYQLIHGGVPMGGYVLLGLVAGLSTALGFLVPPGRARPGGDGMPRRMLG